MPRAIRPALTMTLLLAMCVAILAGCQSPNTLTQAELAREARIDAIVSGLLFDRGLDEQASYNIRRDGTLVIKFADSVSPFEYTEVVEALRADPAIGTVRAEQSGREVCPLQAAHDL